MRFDGYNAGDFSFSHEGAFMKLWQTVAAAVLVAAGSSLAIADNYTIDPVHSSAIFRIKHMNATYLYGRINSPEGTVNWDASNPEASSFDVTLKADNIDTNNKMRDGDLKGPNYFNAKEFPTLTFKSKSVKKTDATHFEVTGDLTIHGVTKSITVPMEHTGDGKMKGTTVSGFETTFTINRSDFGMKEMQGVGDEVKIMVAFEADKK
jgi:polyisoprenoid-binding protein YceI